VSTDIKTLIYLLPFHGYYFILFLFLFLFLWCVNESYRTILRESR
jgi:hypothetical protein